MATTAALRTNILNLQDLVKDLTQNLSEKDTELAKECEERLKVSLYACVLQYQVEADHTQKFKELDALERKYEETLMKTKQNEHRLIEVQKEQAECQR